MLLIAPECISRVEEIWSCFVQKYRRRIYPHFPLYHHFWKKMKYLQCQMWLQISLFTWKA
ncbi:unnamed protein product, partial [Callosobruchus maculatus]